MDHFAPHSSAGFEGYYSRTQLEDGSTLAIIFCWVKHARLRGNLVCVSYNPIGDSDVGSFHHEFYPDDLDTAVEPYAGQLQPFTLSASGIGSMKVAVTEIRYTISVLDPPLSLTLHLTNRTAWSETQPLEGPMGPIMLVSRLLPLNWHVYSTTSDAEYVITHDGITRAGKGKTHIEKNWGNSFPPGWIWGQAFGEDGRSLSLAGGAALPGVQAYLIGYRSPKYKWDFRPPATICLGRLSPFMNVKHDSRSGTFELTVQTLHKKISITMNAFTDTFIPFPAPLRGGHQPGFAYESFKAAAHVELFMRRWPWQEWASVEAGPVGVAPDGSSCAALEYGGAYFRKAAERIES
ncbi:uncharacterized protein LAESUDRAFT_424194 [Laetiporus sulphureus 93-53]|uniref:Uncharacterized protein n=1 Tax=Laetiporus sulphureus 93-53 TaxID=1314785 RepID=A0A165GIS2_9APHY|nr:uncharacterized protein LAESUDRAFT_424194 [Laetiporus sulphureus 93-53]KZT10405.1 hypothetical protein LAESUDRAFT_424194 [Laetiporus sulphureus 93-53]